MSSRVLKKLHGDNELEIKEEISDIDNDIGTGAKKKQFEVNRYDLVSDRNSNLISFCCVVKMCGVMTLYVLQGRTCQTFFAMKFVRNLLPNVSIKCFDLVSTIAVGE